MSIEDPLDGLKQLSDADIDALCDTVKVRALADCERCLSDALTPRTLRKSIRR